METDRPSVLSVRGLGLTSMTKSTYSSQDWARIGVVESKNTPASSRKNTRNVSFCFIDLFLNYT